MCCPPAPGLGGLPSAYARAQAEAATRQYLVEKKNREADQTNEVVSESDKDSNPIHEVSMKPRQSLRTRCHQKLRKCLP